MSSDTRGSSAVIGFLARVSLAAALLLVGWWLGGWPLVLLGAALAVPLFVRTQDGRIWWSAILARTRFRIAQARGRTRFADDEHLPGALARLAMVQAQPFAILADDDGGTLSVVVRFDPHNADWLDDVGGDHAIVAASITAQTGAAVRSGLPIAESAGALTRSVLREALPATAGLPSAWACVTWRSTDQAHGRADIGAFLERHHLRALPGPVVAGVVSTAFSPERAPVTSWERAGPGRAEEFKNRYQHADVTSLVWHVAGGAGGVGDLLNIETTARLERVSALYVPQPSGNGLRQNLVVTLTCPDEHSLAVAASALRRRARDAGVSLAPCAASMATSFALGLGVGVTGATR